MTTIWTEKQINIFRETHPVLFMKCVVKKKAGAYLNSRLLEFHHLLDKEKKTIELFEFETELVK